VYHLWETDEEGNPVLDEEGNLIPAPIDTGDNAWMMTTSALVLLMTHAGLAVFYGGLAGALLTGVFAEKRFTSWGDNGLAFGNPAQLYENAVGAFGALAWAMGITAIIIKAMDAVWPGGIRVTSKEEEIGLDLAQHGERAYVT
jgi:ammonia channel protein AmtB